MYIPQVRDFIDGTIVQASPSRCYKEYTYSPPKPDFNVWIKVGKNKVTEHRSPADKSSFYRIKRSGAIKMTPYTRSRITEEFFISEIEHFSFMLGRPSCSDNGETTGKVYATSSWKMARTFYSDIPKIPLEGKAPDIAGELNSLMSDVTSSNLSTYDLLTEIAELRSTMTTIMGILRAVRQPLKSFKALADTYKKLPNGHKKTSDLWMQYRYAIMPMIYSINDIAKLHKQRRDVYKTDRKSSNINDIRESLVPDENGEYFIIRYSANHRLSAVAKARYAPSDILSRLADQIQINPFVTAWELVPYSFVVDWFANVGDWILAQTSSMGDMAAERKSCRSVRTSAVYEVRHVAKLTFEAKKEYTGLFKDSLYISRSSACDNIVYRKTIESYERQPFTPSDIELQLDVFLNWKRALDAYALSHKPLIKSLRSLKK